jgi:hypothetical protein
MERITGIMHAVSHARMYRCAWLLGWGVNGSDGSEKGF